jgi:uncharacterized RDD family membrane protein YckC
MDNPYRSPELQATEAGPRQYSQTVESHVSYPLVTRFWAANFDTMLACLLVLVVGSQLSERGPAIEALAVVTTYFLYFFIAEALFGRTPVKWLLGLKIAGIARERCSWWQELVRTTLRLIEVNPILLGGLPAGICILCTKRRQRLGDKLAGTVVIRDVPS